MRYITYWFPPLLRYITYWFPWLLRYITYWFPWLLRYITYWFPWLLRYITYGFPPRYWDTSHTGFWLLRFNRSMTTRFAAALMTCPSHGLREHFASNDDIFDSVMSAYKLTLIHTRFVKKSLGTTMWINYKTISQRGTHLFSLCA